MSWRAVVFDLDDTLFPESEFVLSGFRAVGEYLERSHGVPAPAVLGSLARLFEEGVRGTTFDRCLQELGLQEMDVATLVEVYRSHSPAIRPFPGIRELLERLRPTSRIGIVSDGYLEVQRRKLAALGLADLFDAVVFSDEFGRERWKPDPTPFREVLNRLGVEAERAVYVADNPLKDFLGARTAGMSSILCRYSKGDYCTLEPPSERHRADLVVTDVRELTEVLLAAGETEASRSTPL